MLVCDVCGGVNGAGVSVQSVKLGLGPLGSGQHVRYYELCPQCQAKLFAKLCQTIEDTKPKIAITKTQKEKVSGKGN